MSEDLVPMFIPSLSSILVNKEDAKGLPLTEAEVIKIRDSSVAMMVRRSVYDQMAQSRGSWDIDPENCWYDWQMLRREMGREPELDPGIKKTFFSRDAAIEKASISARNTLDYFIRLVDEHGSGAFPCVKTHVTDGEANMNMWLAVDRVQDDSFVASFFEVPTDFRNIKVRDEFMIRRDEVQDWMANLGGTLHGGFSLRIQRERMSESEKESFDQHIGADKYADLPES